MTIKVLLISLVPALAAVCLFIFILIRRRHRFPKITVQCDDRAVNLTNVRFVIAPEKTQIQWRKTGPVDVRTCDIELHAATESVIDAAGFLKRFQDSAYRPGKLVCPYTDQVMDVILHNPYLFPEDWKHLRVWFFGRIYWQSGYGLFVRGLQWNSEQKIPEEIWLWLCENMSETDRVAAVTVLQPEPERSRPKLVSAPA